MNDSGKKLKTEIEKRTRETAKLIEVETKKLAVGEMVLERLETILDLLNAAGFKIVKVTTQRPASAPLPANTVVVQGSAAPMEQAEMATVKNPCCVCGQESVFGEPMPDGTQKTYCRPHGAARQREKAEEDVAASMFKGGTSTNFQRPKPPPGPPPQRTIIQAPPPPPMQGQSDPLKGPFPNNGAALEPPHNPVLDD
jgi:hypothetical protein